MCGCKHEHTDYQPDVEEWACPKCGERAKFRLEPGSPYFDSDCDSLHVNDTVFCCTCLKKYTGKEIALVLYKKAAAKFAAEIPPARPSCEIVDILTTLLDQGQRRRS